MATATFGLFGTGDWSTTERPTNYRQGLLRSNPRGDMLITALQSMTALEKTGDPVFHWWEDELGTSFGTFTAGEIYTNQAMSSALGVSTSAIGTILYIKVNASADDPITNYVQPNSVILITGSEDYRVAVRAGVIEVNRANTTSSYLKVKLLTADTTVDASSLMTADTIIVMPPVFAEGGGAPETTVFGNTMLTNCTSIKKAAVSMTRTAMSTKILRPESDAYKKALQEALVNLGIQMEMELLFGIYKLDTDPHTGQAKRYTMGIRQFISTYGRSTNLDSYKYDTDYSGKTWAQGGYDWLLNKMKDISLYTDLNSIWNVVGNGTLLGLANLARQNGIVMTTPREVEYGIMVSDFVSPFGTVHLATHPLMNRNPALQYTWVGIPQNSIKYRVVEDENGPSDIRLLKDPNANAGGINHMDGRFDIFLVENGYEFFHPKEWFWLNDVGRDNAV